MVTFKPNTVLILSPGDHMVRNQWIRVLLLIIQMNRLKIDFEKVNPFVFEKY